MSNLDKFLEERNRIEIPNNEVEWVNMLARELALGVHRGIWELEFETVTMSEGALGIYHPKTKMLANLNLFSKKRWGITDWSTPIQRLLGMEYIAVNGINFTITRAAFDLLNVTENYNVFISYKRSESSALALLVLARLKEHGFEPFVDMALEAGARWHADLKERIKACDYFIILLGKETLSSPMTVKEINWALEYDKTIFPIWHSGFDLKDIKLPKNDQEVKDAIQQTNAIIVQDESASGYNTAIVELLNRFGITP